MQLMDRKSKVTEWPQNTCADQSDIHSTKRNTPYVKVSQTPSGSDLFLNSSFLFCDKLLGNFAIACSGLFMLYVVCWLILLPFIEPEYRVCIQGWFPHPSFGLSFPIAAGTMFVVSIVAFYGVMMRSSLVMKIHQSHTIHVNKSLPSEEKKTVDDLVSDVERRKKLLMIVSVLLLIFVQPSIIFLMIVIVFGGSYLFFDIRELF